jgi:pimeloyl-ACP methyl ester carboxylesterase
LRERDFDGGPLRLRLCEWGDPAGRVTLVLHGFLEQGAAWDAVATRLPGRIVAPDHRGHGLSEHVGKGGFYHFWDYLADLDALVDHLGAPVDLVGHSMGGTMAVLFAGSQPEKVRRLVLVEGLGVPDAVGDAVTRGRTFLEHRRHPPEHKPLADVEDGVRRMRKGNPGVSLAEAERLVRRTTRPRPDGLLDWTWDARHRYRSPTPFVKEAFVAHLREITAPTLFVYGSQTFYGLPDLAEREAAVRDRRRLVIEGAGHLVHHDRPDALADAIRSHFSA